MAPFSRPLHREGPYSPVGSRVRPRSTATVPESETGGRERPGDDRGSARRRPRILKFLIGAGQQRVQEDAERDVLVGAPAGVQVRASARARQGSQERHRRGAARRRPRRGDAGAPGPGPRLRLSDSAAGARVASRGGRSRRVGARHDPVERARDQIVRRRDRRRRPGGDAPRRFARAASGHAARTPSSHPRRERCRRDARCERTRIPKRSLEPAREYRGRRRAAHLQGAGERAEGARGTRGGRHGPHRRPVASREDGLDVHPGAVDPRPVQDAGL